MRILVVHYTRTGHTKKAAEAIAEALRAVPYEVELEEIVEKKSRGGALGWIGARKDATLKKEAEIEPVAADVSSFDLVVAGTPIWAWTVTPPVRTFLGAHADRIRQAAFFCTTTGGGAGRTFEEMEEAVDRTALATVALAERHIKKEDEYEFLGRIEEFVGDVVRALGRGGISAGRRPVTKKPTETSEEAPDENVLTFETCASFLERFDSLRSGILRSVDVNYAGAAWSVRIAVGARETVVDGADGEEGREVDLLLTIENVKELRLADPSVELSAGGETSDAKLSTGVRIGFLDELVYFDFCPRSDSSETLDDFVRSGLMVAGETCTWVFGP